MPAAMGNGLGRRFPEPLANHLLVLAVPHLAHPAAHAVLPQGRRLQRARKTTLGAHRQRHLLRNVSLHLWRTAHLHRAQTRRALGLAEAEGDCIVGE